MADLTNEIVQPSADVKLHQVSVLFSEIGLQVGILQDLLMEHCEGSEKEAFHALFTLAQKIGYLSDKGCAKTGGIQYRGGADEWFLPSSYRWEPQEQN